MKNLALILTLAAIAPMLTACCDCPRPVCPASTTTIVNPHRGHTTVVTPPDDSATYTTEGGY